MIRSNSRGWRPRSWSPCFEDGQGVLHLLRLGPELAVKHLNMCCRCQAVGALNLTQILRLGLLALADDQQTFILVASRPRAPLQVSRGLPVFGLVVLPIASVHPCFGWCRPIAEKGHGAVSAG